MSVFEGQRNTYQIYNQFVSSDDHGLEVVLAFQKKFGRLPANQVEAAESFVADMPDLPIATARAKVHACIRAINGSKLWETVEHTGTELRPTGKKCDDIQHLKNVIAERAQTIAQKQVVIAEMRAIHVIDPQARRAPTAQQLAVLELFTAENEKMAAYAQCVSAGTMQTHSISSDRHFNQITNELRYMGLLVSTRTLETGRGKGQAQFYIAASKEVATNAEYHLSQIQHKEEHLAPMIAKQQEDVEKLSRWLAQGGKRKKKASAKQPKTLNGKQPIKEADFSKMLPFVMWAPHEQPVGCRVAYRDNKFAVYIQGVGYFGFFQNQYEAKKFAAENK